MSLGRPSEDAINKLAVALVDLLQALPPAPNGAAVKIRPSHPFSNLSHEEWTRSIDLWRSQGASLIERLPIRNCPTCDGTKSNYLFESFDAYPYHECIECRTWFVPLSVTHDLFDDYFDKVPEARRYGDYTQSQATNADAQSSDHERFSAYYRALKKCLGRAPDVVISTLDIGCGVANSLATATDLGFEADGIEVNRHAIALARKLGRRVHFPEDLTSDLIFDSVTMWETLEHIADPMGALKAAHQRLKPDGLLALTVPNLNSPDIRSMRGDSLHIHGGPAWPGHINLWTPTTLRALLRRAGFEPLYLTGQYSTNLEELLAYHLGHWSGVRDYVRTDAPTFELPRFAKDLISAIGPAAAAWQEDFCFAPILFVLARRSDGSARTEVNDYIKDNAATRSLNLRRLYSIPESTGLSCVRGTALDLSRSDWSSAEVELDPQHRLHLKALDLPEFGYLWRSTSLELEAADSIRVRGVLYAGSFTAGLLQRDKWADQAAVTSPGPFEIVLNLPDGPVSLVLSNNARGYGPADAVVDCAEWTSGIKATP